MNNEESLKSIAKSLELISGSLSDINETLHRSPLNVDQNITIHEFMECPEFMECFGDVKKAICSIAGYTDKLSDK